MIHVMMTPLIDYTGQINMAVIMKSKSKPPILTARRLGILNITCSPTSMWIPLNYLQEQERLLKPLTGTPLVVPLV